MKKFDLTPIVDLLDKSINQLKEIQNKKTDMIIHIPENTSYKDFAKEVARVIKEDYGGHNIVPFVRALKNDIGMANNIEFMKTRLHEGDMKGWTTMDNLAEKTRIEENSKDFVICDDINKKPNPYDREKSIAFYEKTMKPRISINQFLEELEGKIEEVKNTLLDQNVEEDTIRIYMPNYVNAQWVKVLPFQIKTNIPALQASFYSGIKIFDSVDDKITIGTTDGGLKGIKPIIIELP